MYVAVKGGRKAIEEAHKLLAKERRGDPATPEITVAQIREQLSLAVDRVQTEGALYDPTLAALAVKQARGDLVEAAFLLRASRATLERFGFSEPVETGKMRARRRISGTFKDLPGGQILGPTFDYTHRLLDRSLLDDDSDTAADAAADAGKDAYADAGTAGGADGKSNGGAGGDGRARHDDDVLADGAGLSETSLADSFAGPSAAPPADKFLVDLGLMEAEPPGLPEDPEPFDLSRQPLDFPLDRPGRLQALARADEGFLLALAYSSQRGYGSVHPFVADLRLGTVEVSLTLPETGLAVTIGEIELTECQAACQFGGGGGRPPMFTRGYGLALGHNERKALSMAVVDRALRSRELGEAVKGPAQDEEFVVCHSDNVEASGFVSHIKLPHYVDFQAEMSMLRHMRAGLEESSDKHDPSDPAPPGRPDVGPPAGSR
ncbi:MAG: carbon-phosphorus lyase complex subunit PhnI [Deltaproteobacteria bacterium]|jgi:alpha-D-ribose 1-methylphosphonate 5-triphosphate synthase subunit PhnI|nr:carbon-phosphorus lyase complex subunit PhnI [Deltaproteobacteria bacterium]